MIKPNQPIYQSRIQNNFIKFAKIMDQTLAREIYRMYLEASGICYGLVCYWLYQRYLEKEQEFFKNLEIISSWNGKKSDLKRFDIENTDDMKKTKTNILVNIFDQIMPAVIFMHKARLLKRDIKIQDFKKSFSFIQSLKEKDIVLEQLPTLEVTATKKEIKKLLQKTLLEHEMVLFGNETKKGILHATGIFFKNGKYYFYDPNEENGEVEFDTLDGVINNIFENSKQISGYQKKIYAKIRIFKFINVNNVDDYIKRLQDYKQALAECLDKENFLKYENIDSKWLYACQSNNKKLIKELIRTNAVKKNNINEKSYDGLTPLIYACKNNNIFLVKYLLKNNAEINVANIYSPIYYACENNNMEILELLLDATDIQLILSEISIRVQEAIIHDAQNILKLLTTKYDVKIIQNINNALAKDNKDNLLVLACKSGNLEILKYLVKVCKLDPLKFDSNGSPLFWHAKNEKIINYLQHNNKTFYEENIKCIDKTENNMLHNACKNGYFETANYLLKQKLFDINQKNKNEKTALQLAFENCGYKADTKNYKEQDRKNNISDFLDEYEYYKIIKMLGKKVKDINKYQYKGYNLLHYACENGHLDLVKILVNNSRDNLNSNDCKLFINKKSTENDKSPLQLAFDNNHEKIVNYLVKNVSETNLNMGDEEDVDSLLHQACENGYVETVEYLLTQHSNKFSINQKNFSGATPLLIACKNGFFDLIKYLIENQQAELKPYEYFGGTYNPLGAACKFGNIEIVKYLLDQKDIDIKELYYSQTPSEIAKEHGFLDIVKLLEEKNNQNKKFTQTRRSQSV